MDFRLKLLALGAFVVLGAAICQAAELSSQSKPQPFRTAYASQDCAPWDGPAWVVTLQTQPVTISNTVQPQFTYPLAMVYVWTGQLPLNRWINLATPGQQLGSITFCKAQGQCQVYSGRVRFSRQEKDELEGEVQTSGAILPALHFKARIFAKRAICG